MSYFVRPLVSCSSQSSGTLNLCKKDFWIPYFVFCTIMVSCWFSNRSCSNISFFYSALTTRSAKALCIITKIDCYSIEKPSTPTLRLHNSCAVHFIKQFIYCTGRKFINKADKLQQKDFDAAATTHGPVFKSLKKLCNFLSIGNLPNSQIYDYPPILLQPSSKFFPKIIEQLRKKGGRNETFSVSIIYWGYT